MEVEKLLIRPPIALKENLRTIAKKKGLTLNGLILMILDNWIQSQKDIANKEAG